MNITDQEAVEVLRSLLQDWKAEPADYAKDTILALTRAIEVLEARGEPVAWEITYPSGGKTITTDAGWITYLEAYPDHHATPLYAAPPAPTVTEATDDQ